MKHSLIISGWLVAWLFVFSLCARADNWPQWRGPAYDGVSQETNLPARWSDTENVAWKLALPGMGSSTPAVWGERIFLTSEDGGDLDEIGPSPNGVRHLCPLFKRERRPLNLAI